MKTVIVGRWNRHSSSREAARQLRRLRSKFSESIIPTAALRSAEDWVVKLLVEELVDAGADLIGDGGIRWDSIYDVSRKIGGCSGFTQLTRIPETNHFHRQPVVWLPLTDGGPILLPDLQFVKNLTIKPVVMCLPGPHTLAKQTQNVDEVGLERLGRAYAEVLNQEAKRLLDAGAAFLRFEEPQMPTRSEDFVIFYDLMNELTAGLDQSKLVLAHWFKPITEPAFFELPFGNFMLDLVDGYGTLRILDEFPEGKNLIAGVVDTRQTRQESYDEILQTLKNVEEHVPPERILLSGSTDFHFLPWDTALEKVKRLAEVGRRFDHAY